MITTSSPTLLRYLNEQSFLTTSNITAFLSFLLLVILLLQREVVRVRYPRCEHRNVRYFDMTAVPLAALLLVVIVLRFIELSATTGV